MKSPLILSFCGSLLLVACENMNNGPGSTAGFDPLSPPGSQLANQSTSGPAAIRPGQFVVASIDNTAFYNERPGTEAEADKLLRRGTSMRVISTSGSFFRVELDDGEVGFVPRVMVEDPSAMADDTSSPFEIYPDGTLPDIPEPDDGVDFDGSTLPVIEPIPDPELDNVPLPEI